ncbi:Lrp/AsnC family transcriptional regulator [Exiguobacterium sp. BRG2]|uniref:Lrp/AsnC family transcriptional regulator n=1 Tax=unclassified Exiguobacterium TaxID=2644629 RepID=UPI0025C640EF|nr:MULTISPECIES: Lrp/AsnC family transcriptional regulator [unclassified Exiguobacterium]MDT0172267.1 Lrp/AsnC family transcriptional regulator [Exiguobacterium sp. BRG2]
MKIDMIDRQILNELAQDSRLSMRSLAKRINLSAPSVTERVRQMESYGLIKRYGLTINYEKLGSPIECLVEATIKEGRYDRFKKYIQQLSNVDFCYRISGDSCFMLKLHFQTFQEAEFFIEQIHPYAHTVTRFIFSEVDTRVTL